MISDTLWPSLIALLEFSWMEDKGRRADACWATAIKKRPWSGQMAANVGARRELWPSSSRKASVFWMLCLKAGFSLEQDAVCWTGYVQIGEGVSAGLWLSDSWGQGRVLPPPGSSCCSAKFWLCTLCCLKLHSWEQFSLRLASVGSTVMADSTKALQVDKEILAGKGNLCLRLWKSCTTSWHAWCYIAGGK